MADAPQQDFKFSDAPIQYLKPKDMRLLAQVLDKTKPFEVHAFIGSKLWRLIVKSDPFLLQGRGKKQFAIVGSVLAVKANDAAEIQQSSYRFQINIRSSKRGSAAYIALHKQGGTTYFGYVTGFLASPMAPQNPILTGAFPQINGMPLVYPFATFPSLYQLGEVKLDPYTVALAGQNPMAAAALLSKGKKRDRDLPLPVAAALLQQQGQQTGAPQKAGDFAANDFADEADVLGRLRALVQ